MESNEKPYVFIEYGKRNQHTHADTHTESATRKHSILVWMMERLYVCVCGHGQMPAKCDFAKYDGQYFMIGCGDDRIIWISIHKVVREKWVCGCV